MFGFLSFIFYLMTGEPRSEKKATRHFQEDLWPLDPSKAPRCAPLRLVFVIALPMPNLYLLKPEGLSSELTTATGRNSPLVKKLQS